MKVLITCSGISNTGKLTTQAALTLLQRRPGRYLWMHAKQSASSLEEAAGDADLAVVLDGCSDCCAGKKISPCSSVPQIHVIATELGIVKNGMGEVRFAEIETVVTHVEKIVQEKEVGSGVS